MILVCAADLFWASKIKGTADGLGIPCRPVRSMEMLEARLVDSPVQALVVDLEMEETALAMIRRAKQAGGGVGKAGSGGVRVVAFGPHVEVETLREARAAGADSVMTRGALAAHLPNVLRSLTLVEKGGESKLDDLDE